jgi:hypothetical protein
LGFIFENRDGNGVDATRKPRLLMIAGVIAACSQQESRWNNSKNKDRATQSKTQQ